MITKYKQSFSNIKWKLLLVILATLFIPLLYSTIRMHFIGDMPNTYSFSIVGNMQWINVFFEVLEETFLLPLFFTLSIILKEKVNNNRKIVGKVYLIAMIYLVFIIIFIVFAQQLLNWLSPHNNKSTALYFVRYEFANRWFIMFIKISITMLIIKNKWKQILIILALQTSLNVSLDTFTISSLNVSLKTGVKGVATNDLITNSIISLISLVYIFKDYNIKISDLRNPIWRTGGSTWLQYIYSGSESFIRNAFFIWFVIKTINKIGTGYEQGDFWVANSFIWSWLLMPIIAMSKYINRDSALYREKRGFFEKYGAIFTMVSIVIIIWLVTIPLYEPFIKHVLNVNRFKIVSHLVKISIIFYVIFAFNEIIDKIFYGSGKAQYMLFQSIITNVVVYIPYYYLKSSMTIDDVAIMFGTSIVVDSFITFGLFAFVNRSTFVKERLAKSR